MKVEPPTLSCRDGVLAENGAAAPKSCLLPLEIHTTSAASGLLLIGKTSKATRTTYNQPALRLYSTEETKSDKRNLRTPILSVSYDSSFFWMNNLPAAPSCRRVIETKSMQNNMFDPGGSRSSPRLPVFGNVARVAL